MLSPNCILTKPIFYVVLEGAQLPHACNRSRTFSFCQYLPYKTLATKLDKPQFDGMKKTNPYTSLNHLKVRSWNFPESCIEPIFYRAFLAHRIPIEIELKTQRKSITNWFGMDSFIHHYLFVMRKHYP